MALAWILVAGYSDATADDLLDLGTRDLARVKTVSGITLAFDPGKITLVYALPRPIGLAKGNASITSVFGLAGGPQEIGPLPSWSVVLSVAEPSLPFRPSASSATLVSA